MTFPVVYIFYFLGIWSYFFVIYYQKVGKRWSGIALNQMLWLLPGFLAVVYAIVMDFVKLTTGYYDRYDEKK
jgi:uncharacterized membrane protein